jgi:hypothetical protein
MVEKNAVTPSPEPRGRRGHAVRLFRGAARERIRRVAGCENFGGSAVTPEVFAACAEFTTAEMRCRERSAAMTAYLSTI